MLKMRSHKGLDEDRGWQMGTRGGSLQKGLPVLGLGDRKVTGSRKCCPCGGDRAADRQDVEGRARGD